MFEKLPLLMWPGSTPKLTILMYHRVLPLPDPLRIGEVHARTFERQMALMARHFAVIPLMEAIETMRLDRIPKRACCITFDDGYADNLTVALPILERFGLPATVFVATGYLDGGRMFNDTVIECVARVAGPILDLQSMNLGTHRIASLEDRREAIKSILGIVRYLPPHERERVVHRMVEVAACGELPSNLMLTTPQVKELSARGIEIGGHTVAHTVLTTLGLEAAQAEILEGKKQLEAITGRRVRTFAYPNGRPGQDYSAQHVELVKSLQFEAAVTTAHGVSDVTDDIYQLPRFAPWGQSTTLLAARITRNAMLGKPASICTSDSEMAVSAPGSQ